MPLRDYQGEAKDSVLNFLEEKREGNPCVVAPTGSGKSHIIAGVIQDVYDRYPAARTVILSHVKEILEQNTSKLLHAWPGAPLGIYSAGMGSKRLGAAITVASIQSIAKKAEMVEPPDLVLIDEAHMIPKRGQGLYRKTIDTWLKGNPRLRVAGFTATPYRLDSGLIHAGEGRILTDICYNIEIPYLVRSGYLAPLVGKNSVAQADLSNVKKSAGEYVQKQAAVACDQDDLTHAAIDEMLRWGHDRKHWLIFCVTVEHCEHVTAALRRRGISADFVTGQSLPMFRQQTINSFKRGEIKALVGCEVFTTGFDAPCIDLIGLLRPTQSTGLYVQMLGRGMRMSPETEKENCLVLDFAGNIETHGPIDQIEIRHTEKSGREKGVFVAPTKTCFVCRTVCHAAKKECDECGYVFTEDEIKHAVEATMAAPYSDIEPPQKFEVREIDYKLHVKRDAKPGSPSRSMRVIYDCGLAREVSDFVCFEHVKFARKKAVKWWIQHGGEPPAPITIAEALERIDELKTVKEVWIKQDGNFDRIISVEFESEEETLERLAWRDEIMDEIGV